MFLSHIDTLENFTQYLTNRAAKNDGMSGGKAFVKGKCFW